MSQWSWVPKALLELRLSELWRGTGSKPGKQPKGKEATLTPETRFQKVSPMTSEKAQDGENYYINVIFLIDHDNYYTKECICPSKWEKKFKLFDWQHPTSQSISSANGDAVALWWCNKREKKDRNEEKNIGTASIYWENIYFPGTVLSSSHAMINLILSWRWR